MTRRSPEAVLVAFVGDLRRAGLTVPVGSTVRFAEAVALVGAADERSVYWAGRATLVPHPEDIATYDRVFAARWRGMAPVTTVTITETVTLLMDADDGGDGPARRRRTATRSTGPSLTVRFSAHEVLRHKDFARYTSAELDEARRLMADLRLAGSLRRSRRQRPSRHERGRPDLRRTVRQALRSGGEPVERRHLQPDQRPRRVVLLCDVSGSMEPYSRALLRFAHAAVVGPGPGRGVRPRHPADPAHPRAVVPRSRHRHGPGRPGRRRLVGRHPPRASGCAGSTTSGACGAWPAARSS